MDAAVEDAGVGADPMIDELQRWFAANIPAASPTTIVHGDFRVGNLIHDADNDKIAAVLDWELSTLGDPLADLSHWMLFYDLAPDQLGGLAGLDLRQLGIRNRPPFSMSIARRAAAPNRSGRSTWLSLITGWL